MSTASQAGLNKNAAESQLSSPGVQAVLALDTQNAKANEIRQTPTSSMQERADKVQREVGDLAGEGAAE